MSDQRDYAWQGTQGPGTTVHEYNTDDFHMESKVISLRTALPCKVVKRPYNPKTGADIPPGTIGPIGVVDVQPLVNQLDGLGNATPHGTVFAVPYFRYQSARGAVIADPEVGDIGEIVAHDRDTSVVRATGAQGNPGSRRKHDFADGVYHGQMLSGSTPTQYITFTSSGLKIADKNNNSIEMANNLITVRVGGATYTFDQNGNFKASGNVFWNTGSTATDAAGHVHSASGGTGNGGPPVPGS